ncbi:MAG: LysM peptidoglycan-binding domain-containing protein, partial [Candidatus Limnocylindria bacterium]
MRTRGLRLAGCLLSAAVALTACSGAAASPMPSATVSGEPTASPAASPSATASPSDVVEPSASPEGTTHIVRAGDTMAAIARAYATTIEQLQAWNADRYPSLATNTNVIEPGWELIVSGDPGVTPLPAPTARHASPLPTTVP